MSSTHKTYKYLLINGLLGKAAAGHNPLVLQAGSKLQNAWDARSVCHKHLVPFEREVMLGRLGNSNEPFLNKPARFPELSLNNAVRRGRDRKVLETIIEIANTIESNEDAFKLLIIAFSLLRQVPVATIASPVRTSNISLLRGVSKVLQKNCEGEALTYAVGFFLTSIINCQSLQVSMHPSNQSGSSSNEIGDIDVLDVSANKIAMAVEVKDKIFSKYDLEHAWGKASQAEADFYFVSRRSYIDEFIASQAELSSSLRNKLIAVETLLATLKISSLNMTVDRIDSFNKSFVAQVRPKETTLEHISSCFQ